jgi:hypothetical protein
VKRADVSLDAALDGTWLSAMAITPEQARSASLVLAAHADDADELRLWLQVIGLLPYESGGPLTDYGRRGPAKRQPDAPHCGACGHPVTAESHKAVCDA